MWAPVPAREAAGVAQSTVLLRWAELGSNSAIRLTVCDQASHLIPEPLLRPQEMG